MMCTSANGQLEVVQLLCEAGANTDKDKQDGRTALMFASDNSHLKVVQLLCDAGADTDNARQDGRTALMFASDNGHMEVVQLLASTTVTWRWRGFSAGQGPTRTRRTRPSCY